MIKTSTLCNTFYFLYYSTKYIKSGDYLPYDLTTLLILSRNWVNSSWVLIQWIDDRFYDLSSSFHVEFRFPSKSDFFRNPIKIIALWWTHILRLRTVLRIRIYWTIYFSTHFKCVSIRNLIIIIIIIKGQPIIQWNRGRRS